MADGKFGSFADLEALAENEVRPLMAALRGVILAVHPDAVEVVRLGDRAATYGVGPKKMSEGYCYVMPQKAWVNLGFYHGVSLRDPDVLLEGTGKRLRHVKLHDTDGCFSPEVRTLIEAALAERKAAF